MFGAEMKKIWTPGIIVLVTTISLLLFFSFMSRWVKPFQFNDGTDKLDVTLELCNDLIDKYGNSIEADEFAEIENEYKQLLSGASTIIAENDLFMQNGIHDYEDYFQYMQNAISGYEGYDYNTYSEMRSLIVQGTEKSSIYLEVYENVIRQYKAAGKDRTNILPFEILVYSNNYFVYLIIWCLICAFLFAAPVMVNDRANNVTANQYSSKRGKKLYRTQYMCMVISVIVIVSIIALTALFVWRTTGTLQYANSEIASFLNMETSVIPLTYGRLLLYFIIITYLLTLGMTNIVFYLSANSTNAINMLIKAIPVLIAGCLVGLLMQGALCESNSIYNILHIPYCELIIALIIFGAGIFLNFGNYRVLRRNDC